MLADVHYNPFDAELGDMMHGNALLPTARPMPRIAMNGLRCC